MSTQPRILIVEDDPALRLLIRRALEPDFSVDEADNGEDALRVIGARQYDVVLLDVMLGPGISGYSVCAGIRQLPGGRDLKIAFCTAMAGITGRRTAHEMGADLLISKPFSPSGLRQELRQLLAASTLPTDAPPE